jgi:hypothetical protein
MTSGTPSRFAPLAFALLLVAAAGGAAHAQTLYGMQGGNKRIWEFANTASPPCLAPSPFSTFCDYGVPACAQVPAPGAVLIAPFGILGDIAINSRTQLPFPGTDTIFLTDGVVIQEYVADPPCGTPGACTPVNAFPVPAGLGPLTGMDMDEWGGLTGGVPTLYVTDGTRIAGLVPTAAGSCNPPTVVFAPCTITLPTAGAQLTDVTWDPTTKTLWGCDTAGFVHHIVLTPSCAVIGSFPVNACGMIKPLQGIAFDLGSGHTNSPGGPALFVTDGFNVAHLDLAGAFAVPSFAVPVPCTPTPGPLNGLAYAAHGVNYGSPEHAVTCGTFGESSVPSSNFGLQYANAPPAQLGVLLMNASPPGTGFVCPPIQASGGRFWVDPAVGLPIFAFFTPPPGQSCVPMPVVIPSTTPLGFQVFFEFLFVSGPTIVDHTQGCSFTLGVP